MRYEEWEKKGGIVPVVITGAAVAGPGNITTRRKKVKKPKRGNFQVRVVDKFRFTCCKVGINASSKWRKVGVGCTHLINDPTICDDASISAWSAYPVAVTQHIALRDPRQ